jgi:hypothetical protein
MEPFCRHGRKEQQMLYQSVAKTLIVVFLLFILSKDD